MFEQKRVILTIMWVFTLSVLYAPVRGRRANRLRFNYNPLPEYVLPAPERIEPENEVIWAEEVDSYLQSREQSLEEGLDEWFFNAANRQKFVTKMQDREKFCELVTKFSDYMTKLIDAWANTDMPLLVKFAHEQPDDFSVLIQKCKVDSPFAFAFYQKQISFFHSWAEANPKIFVNTFLLQDSFVHFWLQNDFEFAWCFMMQYFDHFMSYFHAKDQSKIKDAIESWVKNNFRIFVEKVNATQIFDHDLELFYNWTIKFLELSLKLYDWLDEYEQKELKNPFWTIHKDLSKSGCVKISHNENYWAGLLDLKGLWRKDFITF